MHTTTNYLLINQAVADIITLLWSPAVYAIALAKIHPSGLAGDTLCKFFTGNEIVDVGTSVSIVNLTFLAIERYNALIKPFKYRVRLTMENIPYAVAVMWTLAILVCVTDFIQFKYDESKESCVGPWGLDMDVSMAVFALCMVVVFLLNPCLIVSFCYCQIVHGLFFNNTVCARAYTNEQDKLSKQKLAKLFVTITVAFFTCHIPFAVFMIYVSSRKISDPTRVEEFSIFVTFQALAFLSLTNSCINPIFYAFQSSNYRRGFKRIFYKRNSVGPEPSNAVRTDGLSAFVQRQQQS